jgi:hypothetical protein
VRARPFALGSVAAAACLLAAGLARAQVVGVDAYAPEHRSFESPQHFALEARFVAFTPSIDNDPALAGATPYADFFGSSPKLLGGGEIDWQALRIPHLGTIGPGLGAAYMRATGKGKPTGPHNGETPGEETSLEIVPFYGVAVLRVDVFWRDYGVPLVPWAKVGLGFALWHASNTLGTSSFSDPATGKTLSGQGHSLGTHFALGIGLNLNVFDPYAAKGFDNDMGVNSTYLFAEWTREDLTGLGLQDSVMRVGGTEWTFGVALEF